MTLHMGNDYFVPFSIPQTELLAGTTIEVVAPVDGFVNEILGVVQADVTTGGVISVKIGTVDVTGLALTVADAATKGTTYSDEATQPSAVRKVAKGDRIQVVPAAEFATAGAINGLLRINTGK